ncbi:MAG: hypothetical protein KIC38_03780 [Actinomycetaceae bacterium]|nr:hypothetical protein [Actinomycetaceae bacterium]
MNPQLKDSVVNLYDQYMNQAGGKLKYEDVREKLVPEVMAVLEERERNVETEARTLIKATLDCGALQGSRSIHRSSQTVRRGSVSTDSPHAVYGGAHSRRPHH